MSASDNGPLRLGIAGQGRSGYKIHAKCLIHMQDRFKITAVADVISDRREDAVNEFGAAAYEDYSEMLKAGGFDIFVNALPTPFHVPATIEALEAGYDVVCEKPMAANVAEFDRMVEASERTGKLLAPFQNNRLQPFFEKIQEIIASGVLGKILYVRSVWGGFRRRWDWQTLQKNIGGCLYNTGPHAVDQAVMLFGEDKMPEVFCRMDCNHTFGGDADDHCAVTLYDPKRESPQIEIFISQYTAYEQGDLYNIYGTLGGLHGNATEVKWRYYDPEKAPKQKMWPLWSEDREYPNEDLPWVERFWRLDSEMEKDAVGYTLKSLPSGPAKFYMNVYDHLRKNEPLLITLPQVRRQIQIIEECYRQNPLPRKQ